MIKVIWFVLFLALVVSCLEQPDCVLSSNNNMIGVSFRTMYDGRGDTVAVTRVKVSGTNMTFDSLAVGTSIVIPVSFVTDSSSVSIQTAANQIFKFTAGYKVKPQFISSSCGERYVLSDLALGKASGMDSIKLVNAALTNPAQGNINIYRCPRNVFIKLSFRQWNLDTLPRGKLLTQSISSITDDFSGLAYYAGAVTNTVLLPVNLLSTSATYTFTFADNSIKKLNINYDLYAKALFKHACGTQIFPRKMKVAATAGSFAALQVPRDSVYDPPRTNFEVFTCPINNQISALFRNKAGAYASDTLVSVKADYLQDPLYQNVVVSSAILPINPDANSTTYTFQFNHSTAQLTLNYATATKVFHSECGTQKYFTLAKDVPYTGFSASPKIIQTTVTYPVAVNNIEITQ